MPGYIKVEFASSNVVEIEGRRQDGFSFEVGACEHLAQWTDDGTATAHQYRVRRIAE